MSRFHEILKGQIIPDCKHWATKGRAALCADCILEVAKHSFEAGEACIVDAASSGAMDSGGAIGSADILCKGKSDDYRNGFLLGVEAMVRALEYQVRRPAPWPK